MFRLEVSGGIRKSFPDGLNQVCDIACELMPLRWPAFASTILHNELIGMKKARA
jgi:hypothetical protein